MIKRVLKYYFFFLPVVMFGQIEVYQDEVKVINDNVYFKNAPLTGILYSNDTFDIPNNCECTLKAHYKNGILNGKYTEWHPTGEKKLEIIYDNGRPVTKEIYQNNLISKKIEYKNGKPVKETEYTGKGNIANVKVINGGNTLITYYDEHKKILKKEYYTNGKLVKTEKPNQKLLIEYKNPVTSTQQLYWVRFHKEFDKQLKKDILKFMTQRTLKKDSTSVLNLKKNDIYFKQSSGKIIMTIQTDKDKKVKEYDSNQLNDLYQDLAGLFPVRCNISSIRKETDQEVLFIDIDKGSEDGLSKKTKLYVFDVENALKMSEIKIIKAYKHKAVCRVMSYNEWLKKTLDNKNQIIITE